MELSQPSISRMESGQVLPNQRNVFQWLRICRDALEPEAYAELVALVEESYAEERVNGKCEQAAQRLRNFNFVLLGAGRGWDEAQVPHFADVAAGIGELQEARSGPRERVSIPRRLYEQDPGCYALRVTGDSMAPKLADGDIVVVSPAADLFDGCIVAAYIEPDGDVVKIYRELADGSVLLQPANSEYPAIPLAKSGGREARIWGRVVFQQREL
jgi:SOS-response transcriptional repressor LexA